MIPTRLLVAIGMAAVASACGRADAPPRMLASRAAPTTSPAPEGPRVAPESPSTTLESLSDSVITARISASLISDPSLSGADVSVNTDRGVVHLMGSVSSQEQAAIASAHAQRYDGVMRIDNHLSVNPQ